MGRPIRKNSMLAKRSLHPGRDDEGEEVEMTKGRESIDDRGGKNRGNGTRLVTIKCNKLNEKFKVSELDDWRKVADVLVRLIEPGFVVSLSGPLGAGKTTLVQYLAKLLGAPKRAISPTFALIRTYKVRSTQYAVRRASYSVPRTPYLGVRRLVHVDAYRIDDEKDLVVLDLDEELSEPGTVVLIEWPENAKKWIKSHAKQIVQVTIKL